MPTVINTRQSERREGLPAVLADVLPYKLWDEITKKYSDFLRPEEIRCRKGRHTYVTSGNGNFELSHVCEGEDIERMAERLCGGSLYAHRETLLEGYVTLDGGIRVGVCGRAALEDGKMIGIYDISALNFRLPSPIYGVGEPVCRLLREGGGVLVYSPPAGGKTTLLRSVVARLSTGAAPWRISVVDTRGELSMLRSAAYGTADVLLGYPRERGIEIAARTMNPQLIVCDEIGTPADAEAILASANCGVPLLASAHAGSVAELLRRQSLRRLHEAAVFSCYVGIRHEGGGGEFRYTVTRREDADAFL